MHSNELNKVFCAILAVLTFTVGLQIVTGELFRPRRPAQPAFSVPVEEAASPTTQQPAQEQVNIAELMANADAARGQAAFRQCASCHTAERGGPARIGPNLYGVVGGPMAHAEGFNYSSGMRQAKASGRQWTYEDLYRFLGNPRSYIAGTTMSFPGIRRSGERADVIAYLRAQSENPPPLPQQ